MQEVMQRGAKEIGKILNKGLDRPGLPATGIQAGLPGGSREPQSGLGMPLVGLQGQSLQQDDTITNSADLLVQQAEHDSRAARQWVPHTDADDEEMSHR